MSARNVAGRVAAAVAVVACTLAGSGAALLNAQQPEAVVTLEEAVQLALRHSPQVAQASGAVRTAESAERSAWGAFLPNLSLSSGASLSSTERFNPQTNTTVTGSSDSYNAGLSASVDVFTAGRRGAELRRSRAQTDAQEAALLEQQFTVMLSAKAAFFNRLRADELVRVAEAQLRRAQEGLQAAQRRLDVGSATRSDVLRAQLELSNARQALLRAQSQQHTTGFALGRLVGHDGPVGTRVDAAVEPRPLALSDAELTQIVVGQAPSVRAAEAALGAADATARAVRSQYFPTLRFSSGYDWFNQTAALDGGRTSWSLRLGLSYPFFNGFQREDAAARADVQETIARVEVDDARRGARASLETVLAALRLAEQQIAIAQEAVQVAAEDLRVQQERYRLGASTILDQILSQANLVQAETNLVGSRYDYQLARAELEALVGREL